MAMIHHDLWWSMGFGGSTRILGFGKKQLTFWALYVFFCDCWELGHWKSKRTCIIWTHLTQAEFSQVPKDHLDYLGLFWYCRSCRFVSICAPFVMCFCQAVRPRHFLIPWTESLKDLDCHWLRSNRAAQPVLKCMFKLKCSNIPKVNISDCRLSLNESV